MGYVPRRLGRLLAALIAMLAPGGMLPARAGATADRAVEWLLTQQRADGSFAEDGPADATAEVIATLRTAGVRGEPIARALDRIAADGPARARKDPTYAARIVLGLNAAGEDPRAFRGTDYLAIMDSSRDPIIGGHGGNLFSEAIIGLANVAAGRSVDERTLALIRASRCNEGGYGYDRGCVGRPDTDTTSLVVSLLRHSGDQPTDPSIADALAWMRAVQAADGGFGFSEGQAVNANSTGLAASMIALLGQAWKGRDARPALRQLAAASGGFRYSASSDGLNLYATVQAIPGVLGRWYPLSAVTRAGVTRKSPLTPTPSTRTEPGAPTGEVDQGALRVLPAASEPSAASDGNPAPVRAATPSEERRTRGGPVALAGLSILALLGGLGWRLGRRAA